MLASYAGHAALVHGSVERGPDPNRLNDREQVSIEGVIAFSLGPFSAEQATLHHLS